MKLLLPYALTVVAALVLMHGTLAAMVDIWIRHQTYQHAFIVAPVSLWLVWRLRGELARQPVRPSPWMLLPLAAVCFLWLLGELAEVGTASQFALVSVIVFAVPALFGWAVTRTILFPLLFLYFSVPFGEFMVPTLMDWTADFTVAALRLTGVPVYREGLFFVIPSGHWSVIEACSGLRYLIASVMVGALFAYLNYRSPLRRAAFVLVAIAVPLLANWLRAYMIVMIGHLSNNELAVGVDHLVYGWVFFGVVIALMFVIGMRWSEDAPEAVAEATSAPGAGVVSGRALATAWPFALGVVAIIFGTLVWQRWLEREQSVHPRLEELPVPAGWQREGESLPWAPGFAQASVVRSHELLGGNDRGWIWVGYYRNQGPKRKLVSTANGYLGPEPMGWRVIHEGAMEAGAGGLPGFRTAVLRRGATLSSSSADGQLRVWRVYWVDGRWIHGDARAKLAQAFGRLAGRGDDGAVVLLATHDSPRADETLARLSTAALPQLEAAFESVRSNKN